AARERAGRDVVIASALWGAIAATDRIPAYRLSIGAKIAPKGSPAAWWKGELSPVLEARAADGLSIDCRPGGYQAAWPAPAAQTAGVGVGTVRHGLRDEAGRPLVPTIRRRGAGTDALPNA
ncbi:peroxide stress protein YaaA, partial [Rothia kristinae]